jgi:hypothetical protein
MAYDDLFLVLAVFFQLRQACPCDDNVATSHVYALFCCQKELYEYCFLYEFRTLQLLHVLLLLGRVDKRFSINA